MCIIVRLKLKTKLKMNYRIQKPFSILRMVKQIDLVGGEYRWCYSIKELIQMVVITGEMKLRQKWMAIDMVENKFKKQNWN